MAHRKRTINFLLPRRKSAEHRPPCKKADAVVSWVAIRYMYGADFALFIGVSKNHPADGIKGNGKKTLDRAWVHNQRRQQSADRSKKKSVSCLQSAPTKLHCAKTKTLCMRDASECVYCYRGVSDRSACGDVLLAAFSFAIHPPADTHLSGFLSYFFVPCIYIYSL